MSGLVREDLPIQDQIYLPATHRLGLVDVIPKVPLPVGSCCMWARLRDYELPLHCR